MVIKRSSREDIKATTFEELECLLIDRVPRFKRLTDDIYEKFINHTFDSSKEFSRYVKSVFPRNFPDRQLALGFSKEEVEEERQRIKNVAKKSAKTNKERYGKSVSSFTVEFWIRHGLTEEDARKKVSEIQKRNASKVSKESHLKALPSRIEHWINKGFSEEEAREKVKEHQRKASQRCVEHWINKGFSEEEGREKVKEHQSNAAKEYYKNVSEEEFRKNNHWCKEYYDKRGLTEEDFYKSKETFSLRKCVEKHGKELGQKIWEERQKMWLDSLRNKTAEELSAIKRAKASRTSDASVGYLYIVQVNSDVVKIGITKNSKLHKRYNLKVYDSLCYEMFEVKDYKTAFIIEQQLLYHFKDRIHYNDYGDFGWTECINNIPFNDIKNLINKKIDEHN